jgi:hypothetical protein
MDGSLCGRIGLPCTRKKRRGQICSFNDDTIAANVQRQTEAVPASPHGAQISAQHPTSALKVGASCIAEAAETGCAPLGTLLTGTENTELR